jgi:hypothetical protein
MSDEQLPVFDAATPWGESQRVLAEAGLGDGLPLVPPTNERLEAMLDGISEPARSLAQIPPLYGELTAAVAAYNCVLAGCAPGALPVVVTALLAVTDPAFNLLGVATTTGTPAVATLVHGPIVGELGLSSTTNCLGPGNDANATIGRAVSLMLRNVGGAQPGIGDMATMGQPGKYTFCFAEGDHAWLTPLHARRGLAREDNAVTVFGVSGTAEVLPLRPGETPEQILESVAVSMAASIPVSGAGRRNERGEQVVLLPPEILDTIAASGWDLEAVQAHLFERSRALAPRIDERLLAPVDGAGDGAEPGWDASVAESPRHILPICTGGPGIKMTYMPLWGGGSHPITMRLIEL